MTASQWWWSVRYREREPARIFTTANEIHIPVGQPVRIELTSHDVIHSFWIPQLGGKMDVIPGQTNVTWLQADRPGVYRGQCGEYCGAQHAHMAMVRRRRSGRRTIAPGCAASCDDAARAGVRCRRSAASRSSSPTARPATRCAARRPAASSAPT